MSETEFWYSTPRYFAARQKAWVEREQREWERARFISFFTVKTVDAKNRIKSPESLYRFPWEAKPVEFAPITKEELDKFSAEADEVLRLTNPAAYERYQSQLSVPINRDKLSESSSPDPEMTIEAELDF